VLKKIFFVITARASLSRVKSVIQNCKKKKNLKVYVISAASMVSNKYGEAEKDLQKLGIKSNWRLPCLFDDHDIVSQPNTTANLILQLTSIFHNNRPDAVVSVADRYETIATAIASSYMNIPLIHLLGGEVTGNIDEKVRHAITKLSDIHLVANKDSYNRIKKLGEDPKKIFVTGCPSIDIAKESIKHDLKKIKLDGVGNEIDLSKDYCVVLQHPDTSRFDRSRNDINCILKAMKKINYQTVWFWPNPDAGTSQLSEGIRSFREIEKIKNVYFIKHLRDLDFLCLLKNSKCLIGNSSVGIRECAYLGIPVVNIGDRQKNRLRAENVIDVELNISAIINSIEKQLKKSYKPSIIYGDGNSGKKISDILSESSFSYKKQITY
tara:strand:- start:445 stop:1584 length:1140 start_codon:yes stop_codon:yes gene_type:complete